MFQKGKGKRIKGLLATLMALLLVASISACSSNTKREAHDSAPMQSASSGSSASPYEPKYSTDGGYGYEVMVMEDAATPMATSSSSSSSSNKKKKETVTYVEVDTEDVTNQMDLPDNVMTGRKITFWADYSMNTKNFDADYKAINNMIRQSGGYVSTERTIDNSTKYDRPQPRSSCITAKIPALGYDSFLDGLSGIGEMTSKNKWSQDLTSEYFDTEARIAMLEMRRDRLLNYLLLAEKAEDIIAFERDLSNVLNELDGYQSNKRHLDQIVDYATVEITLVELITPETIGKDGEPLGDRASEAFLLSAENVKSFLEDVVVSLAGAAPVIGLLVAIALILWIIFIVIRKSRGRFKNTRIGKARQKRRDKRAQEKIEKSLHLQELRQQVQAKRFSKKQAQYPPPAPPSETEQQDS